MFEFDYVLRKVTYFTGVYYAEPDLVQHQYGPGSPMAKQKIQEIDDLLLNMQSRMDMLTMRNDGVTKLSERLNVIVVSDHGMTAVSPDRVVNLTTTMNMADIVRIVTTSPVTTIWPKPGRTEAVSSKITGTSR